MFLEKGFCIFFFLYINFKLYLKKRTTIHDSRPLYSYGVAKTKKVFNAVNVCQELPVCTPYGTSTFETLTSKQHLVLSQTFVKQTIIEFG